MGRAPRFPQGQTAFVSFVLWGKKALIGKWWGCFSERSVGLIKEIIIKWENSVWHIAVQTDDLLYGVTCSASIKHRMDFSCITSDNCLSIKRRKIRTYNGPTWHQRGNVPIL